MKKQFVIIILLYATLVFITGCSNTSRASVSSSTSSNKVQPITVDALKKMLAKGLDSQTVIVDVREEVLYHKEHIPGALLIPFADFEKKYTQLDKSKKIILVCHMGSMGEAAGQYLLKQGYTQVYNLTGGMRAWDGKRY